MVCHASHALKHFSEVVTKEMDTVEPTDHVHSGYMGSDILVYVGPEKSALSSLIGKYTV